MLQRRCRTPRWKPLQALIEEVGFPPDLVEETDPVAVSTGVHVPDLADRTEPGPNPERDTPPRKRRRLRIRNRIPPSHGPDAQSRSGGAGV